MSIETKEARVPEVAPGGAGESDGADEDRAMAVTGCVADRHRMSGADAGNDCGEARWRNVKSVDRAIQLKCETV